ncbi:MAG TPA: IS1634 family transposase [Nocardioidaceae bacterium]|nr:IS1634 family transposase [Nocardioidaceae bacterium]
MAFIRRVRTASGATAVQLAEYAGGGRQRIVKHLGSAHTEAELGMLLEQARALLADPAQSMLELGVEPTPPVAALAAEVGEPGLFDVPEQRSRGQQSDGRDRPGRVVATGSRLLYEALAVVYDGLGFDVLGDETFRNLVVARIVEPTSLLDSARVLIDLGVAPASYSTMKRTLRRVKTGKYRDQIATKCFAHAVASGDVSLCLYDVTTLYFEAENEDALRKVGYSKERRVDPQIVVGLLVDRNGFPLEIGCFEGDKAETLTIVSIVEQFAERHGIADMVVVADAGMLSAKNLTALDEAHLRFIVGSRATKAPIDLASHFRWHGDAFTDGQIIDTGTPKHSRTIENDPAKKAEPVWDPGQHPASWRAVWAYSAKRAARDNKTLTIQENRAKEVIEGKKKAKATRFVKTTDGKRALDEASLARARKLVGLKGYVANIDVATMPAGEVIGKYHDLWHVEQSFRMSKTDLRARPIFHHTRDAIEAHLTVVFTALAVAREAQNRTGLAIGNLVRQLRPLRSATIAVNGARQTFNPEIAPHHQEILDALNQLHGTH